MTETPKTSIASENWGLGTSMMCHYDEAKLSPVPPSWIIPVPKSPLNQPSEQQTKGKRDGDDKWDA